jgi:hypothetical protein
VTDDLLIKPAVGAELFHTAAGIAFADLVIDGHRETWPIRSTRFRSWLRRCYYEATHSAPSADAIRSTLDLLDARAQFDAPERAIHVRVAEHEGRFYLDLADDAWRVVEIAPDGWQVVVRPPVRFARRAGMLALPIPEQGGSIEALAPFLNLPSRNELVLVIAWLLAALRPVGPYPLLQISGEQGSAKTVVSKMLRALVDPNAAPARALPREDRDLFIAANNGHVLTFDNQSALPARVSDTLCRLASGGGFAVRRLYTDQDEVLFEASRPIVLNGIEEVITRSDLVDRAIFVTLAAIPEPRRRSEKDLWREFETARPRILGALLDAASHGLRRLPRIRLDRIPRMADFALWAAACETAFWSAGTFAHAYAANRRTAVEGIIDADPVTACVREIMAEQTSWTGSASELLRVGADLGGGDARRGGRGWPRHPRALAGRLRRAQTSLRTLGIEMTFGREGRAGTRIIRMSKAPENTVSTDSSVRNNGSRSGQRHPAPGPETGRQERRRC